MARQATSLADALPKAIKEAQAWRDEMIATAAVMGPAGNGCLISAEVARVFIEAAINAMASGDVVAMLAAYENVKGYGDD